MSYQVGSDLLKARSLLLLHISKNTHPWDISLRHRCLLAHTRQVFRIPGAVTEVIWTRERCKTVNSRGTTWYGDVRIAQLLHADAFFFFPLVCSSSCVYIATFVKDCIDNILCSSTVWAQSAFDVSAVGAGLLAESGFRYPPESAGFWAAPSGCIQGPVDSHRIAQACGALALGWEREDPWPELGCQHKKNGIGLSLQGQRKAPVFTCPTLILYVGVKKGRKGWLGCHHASLILGRFGLKRSWTGFISHWLQYCW